MVSLPQEDFIDQCSVCFTWFQGVSGWDSCGSMGGLGNALADDSELRWNCMMFTTSSVDIRTRATKKKKHGPRGRRAGWPAILACACFESFRMTSQWPCLGDIGDALRTPAVRFGFPSVSIPLVDAGDPDQMISEVRRSALFDCRDALKLSKPLLYILLLFINILTSSFCLLFLFFFSIFPFIPYYYRSLTLTISLFSYWISSTG